MSDDQILLAAFLLAIGIPIVAMIIIATIRHRLTDRTYCPHCHRIKQQIVIPPLAVTRKVPIQNIEKQIIITQLDNNQKL